MKRVYHVILKFLVWASGIRTFETHSGHKKGDVWTHIAWRRHVFGRYRHRVIRRTT